MFLASGSRSSIDRRARRLRYWQRTAKAKGDDFAITTVAAAWFNVCAIHCPRL
jgi:hypothetical protein